MLEPKVIVQRGYDRVSHAYRGDQFDYDGSGYERCLNWLLPRLAPGARVLDLGCGNGIPVAGQLASAGLRVVGADLSAVQVGRARRLVPQGAFLQADMTRLAFAPASFAAVTAFFSIIHLPLPEQQPFLERLAGWLAPGGLLLISAGIEAWTGTEEDWRGVPGATMYWSHADAATYRRWLAQMGFVFLRQGRIGRRDDSHSVFLCRLERR